MSVQERLGTEADHDEAARMASEVQRLVMVDCKKKLAKGAAEGGPQSMWCQVLVEVAGDLLSACPQPSRGKFVEQLQNRIAEAANRQA